MIKQENKYIKLGNIHLFKYSFKNSLFNNSITNNGFST